MANVVHAAGESSPGGLLPGTYAVCLHAQDEAELKLITRKLRDAKIDFRAVCEPEPPHNGALMAIGIVPVRAHSSERYTLNRILSSLPLAKEAK